MMFVLDVDLNFAAIKLPDQKKVKYGIDANQHVFRQ
jgi:hypothetical protein